MRQPAFCYCTYSSLIAVTAVISATLPVLPWSLLRSAYSAPFCRPAHGEREDLAGPVRNGRSGTCDEGLSASGGNLMPFKCSPVELSAFDPLSNRYTSDVCPRCSDHPSPSHRNIQKGWGRYGTSEGRARYVGRDQELLVDFPLLLHHGMHTRQSSPVFPRPNMDAKTVLNVLGL